MDCAPPPTADMTGTVDGGVHLDEGQQIVAAERMADVWAAAYAAP